MYEILSTQKHMTYSPLVFTIWIDEYFLEILITYLNTLIPIFTHLKYLARKRKIGVAE